MEFDQLMTDILVYVSCKFEMYIFKLAQVISENIRIAFLYVLSILSSLHTLFSTQSLSMTLLSSLIARRWVGAQTQMMGLRHKAIH